MDPNIKMEWVAALRDPEAIQCTGKLGDAQGGRCCLGVLSDIAVKHGIIGPPRLPTADEAEEGLIYGTKQGEDDYAPDDYSDTELIPSVARWAGMESDEQQKVVLSDDPNCRWHLAAVNDGQEANRQGGYLRPHSFAEIADLIEEQL